MTLEDFEKSLAAKRAASDRHGADDRGTKRRRHDDDRSHHHRRPRDDESHRRHRHRHRDRTHDDKVRNRYEGERSNSQFPEGSQADKPRSDDGRRTTISSALKRDSWMEAPSALDVEVIHRKAHQKDSPPTPFVPSSSDMQTVSDEVNGSNGPVPQTQDLTTEASAHESSPLTVDYCFGDAGAQWRMTKLKGVYRQAKEGARSVDDVAIERFGTLRAFDAAREEETELQRRETYGEGYVGKTKPCGDLFQQRQSDMEILGEEQKLRERPVNPESTDKAPHVDHTHRMLPEAALSPSVDQTALNKLKARLMKAKLTHSPAAKALESEYNEAAVRLRSQEESGTVVLGAMENRMLAAGRKGEVKAVTNRRGRERGQVEENEDMSIEDMVREERRSKGQSEGSGRQMAERIAKDGKFDNDLDYLDENAAKLAKRVQRSEINLKSAAISDFQKMNRILDSCPLCHHEDTNVPPIAPIVSLATRVYLTLPTEPEISDGGACIVPIQHRTNLLECDDDEWEEIRNFQKSLTRMYHDQGRDVIFYENAAAPQRHRHAAMEVVPLPYELGETAPAFFKEAILASEEEWTQHQKLIDTMARARRGVGKTAVRNALAKEMPYFHVWFTIDGGLGHIVEDSNRWPRGDLFAREIIGGMLDVGPDIIKRQGRWTKGDVHRIEGFRKRWRPFDWTRVLTEP